MPINGFVVLYHTIQPSHIRRKRVFQIQKLMDKCDPEDTAVDGFLLNLGGTFSYLYMCFTITVGMFTTDLKDIPGSLHIVNGVIDIVQMASQIVLINLLLKKVNTWNSKHLLTTFKKVIKSGNDDHPGRQAITFLVSVCCSQL